MATLNIISTSTGAGKTALAGALAQRLSAKDRKAAYYKPLSANPEADPDLEFVAGLLETWGIGQTGIPAPFPQPIDPQSPPARLSEARAAEVTETVDRLETEYDDVLIDWDAPAAPPGRPVLMIHSQIEGQDQDAALALIGKESERYGEYLTGIIVNNVLRHRKREVESGLVSALRDRGLPALGAIPEDREMLALTLAQVAQFLGGRWVEEPGDPQRWVDRFLIGGNIMDSGPNYFGRYPNQAVITRAGRPDIQMASLMCDTKLLVLTGGEEPTEYIQVEAQKRDSSLLMVDADTLEIAESLGTLLAMANPYAMHKLDRFTRLMEDNLRGGLDGILG